MNKLIAKYSWVALGAVLIIGIVLGSLLFGGHGSETADGHNHSGHTMYTCSMDPQIKQDKPGRCPICGMDLIPVGSNTGGSDIDPNAVMMSDEAVALANIETQVVGSGAGNKEIRLFGKVEPDERLQQTQAAYVAGRIERLFINAVGDRVIKGQTLAVIYSPELYASEQELVAALGYPESAQRQALIEAAKEKLRLLNMTPAQIDTVVKSRKASPYIRLKANTGGTVVEKKVSQGDYVTQGAALLKIANLSRVWMMFEAYEADLPFVKTGATIHFTGEALPGRTFEGRVSFVEPVLDPTTRTAGVRVEMANPQGLFKPGMIVTGNAVAHMKQYADEIVVPKSAVLWTGKRSVVYVKEDGEQPTFMMRRVTLGPSLPDGYIIADGLAEGEEVVTNGAFAIDAGAQLGGKHSMMNQ